MVSWIYVASNGELEKIPDGSILDREGIGTNKVMTDEV